MKQQDTTYSVRIDAELVEKIKSIAKSKGQTISGYINVNLSKPVERDWQKFKEKQENGLQQSSH
jgi:predicted DNA-binding protein